MLLAQHERIHGKVEVISLVPTKIQNKKTPFWESFCFGAFNRNRTDDLILTMLRF
jgi:hypothetical protein